MITLGVGGTPTPLPKNSGRSLEYWQLRAVQTLDPRSFFGRPWNELTYTEQVKLIAFSTLRMEEEANIDDE